MKWAGKQAVLAVIERKNEGTLKSGRINPKAAKENLNADEIKKSIKNG
jgi:hypothetical protein